MNEQDKISELDELKKMAPTLSSLKKGNHFSVPQDYFDEFPINLKNRIDEQESTSTKFSLAWLFNYQVLAPISSLIVIMILGLIYGTPEKSVELEDLSANEIELSLEYYGYPSIDDEILAELYTEESNNIESISKEELSEEEIIDYLLEENVDVSQIYFEL